MIIKRVFLALPVEPVEPAAEILIRLQKRLSEYRIKWVPLTNFHLTLFFFGEIPAAQIPLITGPLHDVIMKQPPLNFSMTGPGIFKKGEEPQVLWLGIQDAGPMSALKKEIDQALSAIAFLTENKPFRPHLTLGRFNGRQKVSSGLLSVLKEEQLSAPIACSSSKLILFESKLSPAGPTYIPLEVFPLIS